MKQNSIDIFTSEGIHSKLVDLNNIFSCDTKISFKISL